MAYYDQREADRRHRLRQGRIKKIRDELSDILNDYWDRYPRSSGEESELEYKIEERLRYVHRDMDNFVREFRYLPNE
ncbi:MAG: hypothetical protein COT92_00545 [Candidatus Doudnabacteria bacterium CG10_big_fil_rev_8_21_14_0_10_42_18]|uniref:Uncharacterized protein n=1 Tax=Candidatus Doudnabacteria bacterium CG10_big_fil_rev_8_21_14_0_10_42_18 TaxID=1974552 RepID=A0A2H0VBQ1_9BACT|nr:MAG: hypothetical protein COT92_00545 [Candidatus Doudnabacteria bacterium CG10_big_fil_rev_8_21_14_0_10_42_18]